MEKSAVIARIGEAGFICIIRRPVQEKVYEMIDALVAGGVRALEITADTPNVERIITQTKEKYQDQIVVGAGTVLDSATAKKMIDAGADFILSPHLNEETIRMTNRYGKVSIPGCMTPTEIESAYAVGADVIKVFPAEPLGVGYVQTLKGPLGHIPLIPTGGISTDNVKEYIQKGAFALGIGGNLADPKAVKEDRFDQLTAYAAEFCSLIKDARQEMK